MPTRFALLAVFAIVGCFSWSMSSRAQDPPPPDAPAPVIDESSTDHARPFMFRTEYLLWWMKSAPMPVLLTTDPTNGATPTAGGLGDPTTQVVLGNGGASFDPAPGVRIELGFPICENVSFEGGGFVLGTERATLAAGSNANGSPFLFRPFVNIDNVNVNAGGFVSLPGLVAGSFQAISETQLWGLDPHAYFRVIDSGGVRFGWIAGFRYLDLQESLELDDSRTLLAGGGNFNGALTAPGDRLMLVDSFKTHNQFWGGQIGAHGETEWGRLVLTGDMRLSLGAMDEIVDVVGYTKYFPVGGTSVIAPGGLLALPSNTGHRNASDFVLVPELTVGAGYQLTPGVRLSVGYDFLYVSRVVRPGDQVPMVVSASQIPTSPSFAGATSSVPEPVANRSDFWAQGIHAELTIRY